MYNSTYSYKYLDHNEYSQGLCYHAFAVNLDTCVGICNTFNDLSNRVCVPNKTEDLNRNVFNFMTWIIESEILTEHLSYKC